MDFLTVIEEHNDFNNANMFSDEEDDEIRSYRRQQDEMYDSIIYNLNRTKLTAEGTPNDQQLEELTYNSFLNLFEARNSGSQRTPGSVSHSNTTSNDSMPSRLLTASTAVGSGNPLVNKHFSTSVVSSVSTATAVSSNRFSFSSPTLYSKKKAKEEYSQELVPRLEINLEFYDLTSEDYNGVPFNFSLLFDKVVMIVNVASFCGFTKQYSDLESLYEKYNSKGFEIIAFPSNQFLQEPKSENEIVQFCSLKFNVSFPVMKKIRVNGRKTSPIYEYLKKQKKGAMHSKRVLWNFEKFLVDKRGNVVDRGTAFKKPKDFEDLIARLLDE